MASYSKAQLVSIVLIACLLLQIAQATNTDTDATDPTTTSGKGNVFGDLKIDCGLACTGRCQLSSRQKLCQRACGECCVRCNCVPPGTSGNKEFCPCYARLTTHNNRFKCP
ncbi:hypothetical protein MLD38_001821 [Melastoma candidum]|uniref:Uncharacterized protein n=1 Tax=Melastoma candidum TaxID=119954 RepID=A0ACB9SJD5_9MYRT|nr:hypothetical protein MLD38_001821 [Melastoma candidum]